MADELPIISFESEAAWEQWLEDNYTDTVGLWMKIAKKESAHTTVLYPEALNVALCFGWIDGQKKKFDDEFWLQKFTPRRVKSLWSQVNRDKVAELIEQGRMREAGHKEIERAKADGRWDAAYSSASMISEPDDFLAALEANPAAKAFYETLNKTNRYSILFQITTAKKAETRQKRIDQFVVMLSEGKKLY